VHFSAALQLFMMPPLNMLLAGCKFFEVLRYVTVLAARILLLLQMQSMRCPQASSPT
jgi:hypothetical protein